VRLDPLRRLFVGAGPAGEARQRRAPALVPGLTRSASDRLRARVVVASPLVLALGSIAASGLLTPRTISARPSSPFPVRCAFGRRPFASALTLALDLGLILPGRAATAATAASLAGSRFAVGGVRRASGSCGVVRRSPGLGRRSVRILVVVVRQPGVPFVTGAPVRRRKIAANATLALPLVGRLSRRGARSTGLDALPLMPGSDYSALDGWCC